MNGFEDCFCSRKSVLNKNDGMAIPPKRRWRMQTSPGYWEFNRLNLMNPGRVAYWWTRTARLPTNAGEGNDSNQAS